uniref:Uncharacterized protein n=1 Tax=Haptolina brevifila TaxID=156173 RepID=A0A7S2BW03_9EUKA
MLDECKVAVFEAATGLKLGSVLQGSLVVNAYSSIETTLTVNGLAEKLPQREQRRLATDYLAKKALLVTLVATASSRLPIKSSTPTTTTSNNTRRVDFNALHKDSSHNPFFQRAPQPED